MLRLDNTAEGLAAGEVVTNSNTAGISGDAFEQQQGAASPIRGSARFAHGTRGYEFATAANESSYLQWTGDAEPSYAIRGYLWFDAFPGVAANTSVPFAMVRTAAGTAASAALTGAGMFRIRDSAGNALTSATTAATLGTVYRYEMRVTPGTTTTNGTVAFAAYVGDSTTPFVTLDGTGNIRTDQPQQARFGQSTAATVAWTHWQDDLALQTGGTGFIGPFATPNTAPIANAGSDQSIDPWTDAPVTLTGTDTDTDGTVVARTWAQTGGTSVTLTGTGATRTFAAPTLMDGGTLEFTYIVTDDRGQQAADTVKTFLLPVPERAIIGGTEVPIRREAVASGVSAPAAPVLTAISEPLPRASRVERNTVEPGTVWDLYELGSTNAVATSLTGTSRQSGQVLSAGAKYTYWAKARRLSDGAVSAESNRVTITMASGVLAATDSYIVEARTYYPDGTGEWAHLPHYRTWKPIYWLPNDGIPFTPPQNADGTTPLVMRGQRCRGSSTAVLDYTGGTNCARIICPRVFTNETIGKWGEVDLWRGVILQGFHMKNPGFLGHNDWPIYKSDAAATAETGGITPVRPGYWKYNPWSTGVVGDDEGSIDNRVGTGRMHERSIYLRPGSGVSTEKSFYGIEGMYLEGDWIVEGLNVNGINSTGNTRVVVAGYRHDRVSVYFRKSSTADSYGGKWPGGDSMQWFGAINDIIVIGGTALTHYQAQFLQHSSRKMITVHDFNSRVAPVEANGDPTYYGGSGGFQADLGSSRDSWVTYDFRNWYVWRNGAGTVDPPLFPEIKSELVPDYVKPTDRIGVAYAAEPLPM